MEKQYVKQHTVSKFILKNFANRGKKKSFSCFCYDKMLGESFPSNIANIAFKKYFYDRYPNEIEIFLGKSAESLYAICYKKIIERNSITWMDFMDRFLIAYLIFTQNERTMTARLIHSQRIKLHYDIVAAATNNKELNDGIKKLDKKFYDQAGKMNQLITMFGKEKNPAHVLEIAEKLVLNFRWRLLINNSKQKFFLSDHPIILINKNEIFFSNIYDKYLTNGTEIYFPLNEELCLYLQNCASLDIHQPENIKKISKSQVRIVNSFAIINAYRQIYSKTNNFKFVEKFLKTHLYFKHTDRFRDFDNFIINYILKPKFWKGKLLN